MPNPVSGWDAGGAGPFRAGADRVLVSVKEDFPLGVLPLEFGDAGEDVFERRGLVIRIDPEVHRLLGPFGRPTGSGHEAPNGPVRG